jgi:UDP-N-acetylglucosamine/UDP-N-acetylgalactosamine diphosphorylase
VSISNSRADAASAERRAAGLRVAFDAAGQGQVFRFWDRLEVASRERLLAQLERLDLAIVREAQRAIRSSGSGLSGALKPAEVERHPSRGGSPARFAEAERRGREILAAGRVAALVVAGGQATRLGFGGPKGCFPLGPVTGRSLFEIQAQKLRGLARKFGVRVPWYVMTSTATDADTRSFLDRNQRFGIEAEDLRIFCQGSVPSLDLEGRLILSAPDQVFENPDGHGGVVPALLRSGSLDELAARGVDTLFFYQVDNPLVRMADPAFLGLHDLARAEVSCKVVRKQEPGEKVGVLATRGGRTTVVEYTELADAERNARAADGGLAFWAGNIAMHVFSLAFLRRIAARSEQLLPFHPSAKPIPMLDERGAPVTPSAPNGYKLERFVFDALSAADRVCAVEALREEEFAPVKNASGSDSPETSRAALQACYRRWLADAKVEAPAESAAIEIDHARVDGPDDARALGVQRWSQAADAIRAGIGA